VPASQDMEGFARLIEALHPWLDQLVVIGGWAHRLYRLHPLAQRLDYDPLATLDADIAVPAELPVAGQDIYERLIANGFQEEKLGEARPPAAHYHLVSGRTGFYAEFLTPLEGSAAGRNGERDATVRVAGVSSQKLRYIDLLLIAPWTVEIGMVARHPTPQIRRIQLPAPASFLAQKVLIHHKRDRADRAKDVLYIHDTIETFSGALPEIREEWDAIVKHGLHRKAILQVEKAADVLFAKLDDTIREAALIATGRNLTPESIREVCNYGWNQLFRG
jgi:hypothetical protein